MIRLENPVLPVTANLERSDAYNDTVHDLRHVLAEIAAQRQALIERLEQLPKDQWLHQGTHPQQGTATIIDVAINAVFHDIDHIEQLGRCCQSLA